MLLVTTYDLDDDGLRRRRGPLGRLVDQPAALECPLPWGA